MSWITPIAWLFGAGALAVLVGAHMISRKQPPPEPLPTARFVPERGARVSSRGLSLSDVVLLALRALAIILIVAAFAGPVARRAKGRVGRVVVIDRSWYVADMREVRDSVRRVAATANAIVVFDSAARVVQSAKELDTLAIARAPGRISVALVAAMRAGAQVALESDSVELVLVSPLVASEFDDATPALRTGWPGRIRLLRVAARRSSTAPRAVETDGSLDDPVVAGLSLAALRSVSPVRVRRADVSAGDSAWASEADHVLVHWPADSARGWRARAPVDSIGAVVAGDVVVAAPFARRWIVEGMPVARWVDGEVAAVERATGSGCIRDVAIPVDPASDVALRPEFRRLLRALTLPCAFTPRETTGESVVRMIEGAGALAPASPLRAARAERSSWTPWLFGLALALLGTEWWARRARVAT